MLLILATAGFVGVCAVFGLALHDFSPLDNVGMMVCINKNIRLKNFL